jgi:extracellular sulfatase Sulf
MSFPSPHGPEDSAPQYSDMFFNVTRHRTPSYDFAPNPDKQWILRWLGKMKPVHHRFTDLLMTKRLQTLQSVDEAVEKIFSELVALGQLENTYIFYTSDHGYHLGQFGLIKGTEFLLFLRLSFLLKGDFSSFFLSSDCHLFIRVCLTIVNFCALPFLVFLVGGLLFCQSTVKNSRFLMDIF